MKKIVVIGPESTGKSTLSAALAKELQTVWVPEYARTYLDNIQRSYVEDDLLHIAEGQMAQEDKLGTTANNFLVCDTDLYVIKVWSEHSYGRCNRQILEQIATRPYDLYLLTYIDVAWENDPQREHGNDAMRHYFYNQYRDIVTESSVPWVDIRGNETERLQNAMKAVRHHFLD